MKITPIISIEDSFLGLSKPEWAVLLFVYFCSDVVATYIMSVSSLRYVITFLFLIAILAKKRFEKKEQNFFGILLANRSLPGLIVGVLSNRRVAYRRVSRNGAGIFNR